MYTIGKREWPNSSNRIRKNHRFKFPAITKHTQWNFCNSRFNNQGSDSSPRKCIVNTKIRIFFIFDISSKGYFFQFFALIECLISDKVYTIRNIDVFKIIATHKCIRFDPSNPLKKNNSFD